MTSLGALGSILKTDANSAGDATGFFAEGIERLTPYFLKMPDAFTPLIQALAREYLESCENAGIQADSALLQPIVDQLQASESTDNGDD